MRASSSWQALIRQNEKSRGIFRKKFRTIENTVIRVSVAIGMRQCPSYSNFLLVPSNEKNLLSKASIEATQEPKPLTTIDDDYNRIRDSPPPLRFLLGNKGIRCVSTTPTKSIGLSVICICVTKQS